MSRTIRCPNDHAVPDGEEYCPVCGVARPAPEATADPLRRAASVFTAKGEAQVADAIAGEMACPRCGHAISYTVGESGDPIYCPRCGCATTVGTSPEPVPPPPLPAAPPAPPPPRRRPRRWATAIVPCVVLISIGIYLSRSHPEVLPVDVGVLPWSKALVSGTATAPVDPSAPPPTVKATPPPRPEPKITLAMIAELRDRPDAPAALTDALHWKDALADFGVAATDTRLVRLGETIPELERRLRDARPTSTGPSVVEEFFKRLEQMADALKRAELPAARTAFAAAEALLTKSPAELEKYREVFQKHKNWLQLAERPAQPDRDVPRAADVQKLLADAYARAKPATVTEAMELLVRAVFLSRRATSATDADVVALRARTAEVVVEVRRARGLRAAEDARRCWDKGDAEAMKRVTTLALELLPTFTNQPDCLSAYQNAKSLVGRSKSPASGSAVGKAVLFRCDYEAALEAFQANEFPAGVNAAVRARERATPDEARRLTDVVFDALAVAVADIDEVADRAAPRAMRVTEARTALDRAKPWREDPRWGKLDAVLRQRTGPDS